jgi:hypothetical protein
MHHIRATLPDIKARIAVQLAKYQAELKSLGGAMGETNPVSDSDGSSPSGIGLSVLYIMAGERRSFNNHRVLCRVPNCHRR